MQSNAQNIVIIGAGKLGRAIGKLLGENGYSITFWDIDPEKMPSSTPQLGEIISTATHILCTVPSSAMRNVLETITSFLPPHATVISFSKGIDEESLMTMGELLPHVLPEGQPFGIVGGPMLADEIAAGKNAVCVVASPDEAVLADLSALFSSPRLRVETSGDVAGISLAGVLKNIYAVAMGAADELALGDNEKGWLSTQALAEMSGIAQVFDADVHTVQGTAGLGDFIATAYSSYSQNRMTGVALVKNTLPPLRGEGLLSLPLLIKRLGATAKKYPLLNLVNEIGIENKPVADSFSRLFHLQYLSMPTT